VLFTLMRFPEIMRFSSLNPLANVRLTVLPAALLLALFALLAATAVPGEAGARSHKRIVLGKSNRNPTPNCGTASAGRDCSVEGKVTAYQAMQPGARKSAFRVPYRKGQIISWSISLSRPTRKQTDKYGAAQTPFFNQLFGSPAKARIAVLRRVEKRRKGPPRYKMVRQSPTEVLNPYFGRTVHFALARPLYVMRDQLVAITIPTWAPAFWTPKSCSASSLGGVVDPVACARAKRTYTYRGSRAPDRCKLGFDPKTDKPNEALRKTRPQQVVNSVKRYGCHYKGSRLLYTATVVAR